MTCRQLIPQTEQNSEELSHLCVHCSLHSVQIPVVLSQLCVHGLFLLHPPIDSRAASARMVQISFFILVILLIFTAWTFGFVVYKLREFTADGTHAEPACPDAVVADGVSVCGFLVGGGVTVNTTVLSHGWCSFLQGNGCFCRPQESGMALRGCGLVAVVFWNSCFPSFV